MIASRVGGSAAANESAPYRRDAVSSSPRSTSRQVSRSSGMSAYW